jgi:hypothetical protein
MAARFIGVAGLPRSGSLLCKPLGEHRQIHNYGSEARSFSRFAPALPG